MRAVVLDAGALIALERRHKRMIALLQELVTAEVSAHVPASVVAQVWRGSARQHALVKLLQAEAVRVDALTESTAYQVGLLLGASRSADVTAAHVAILARSLSAKVLTSDADDLRRLDPKIEIVPV